MFEAFEVIGYDATSKSKLAYGNTMSTVDPPFRLFPMLKVKVGLFAINDS